MPFTFAAGSPAYANQVNANFAACQVAINNIDATNIGPVGLYPSQLVATSGPQATLGGAYGLTIFPGSTSPTIGAGQVPLTLIGVSGQTADLFDVFLSSGGQKALWVSAQGLVVATNMNLQNLTVSNQISAGTSLLLSGSTLSVTAGSLNLNSLANNSTPVQVNYGNTNAAGLAIYDGGTTNALGPLRVGTITLTTGGSTLLGSAGFFADGSNNLTLNAPSGQSPSTWNVAGSLVSSITSSGLYSGPGAVFNGLASALTTQTGIYSDGSGNLILNVLGSQSFSFRNNNVQLALVSASSASFTGVVVPGNNGFSGTCQITGGNGSPNGAVGAPNGSLWMRYDGGGGARLYLNTSGASTSGTTWTAIA